MQSQMKIQMIRKFISLGLFFFNHSLLILSAIQKIFVQYNQMGNCETMILFDGRASFTPNTINNNVWTYAYSYTWQEKNTEEMNKGVPKKDQKYTYEKWIQLIFNINAFRKDWAGYDNRSFFCFNDWQVYGDGMYLPEYRAVGVFNPNTDNKIRLFSDEEKFLITSKLGQHKAALADQDTDAQMFSKLFAFSFKADQDLKISFKPSSFRYINKRTYNESAFDTSAQADWFLTGHSKPSYSSELKEVGKIKNKYLQPLVDKDVLLRMNMHRYNQATKVGSCVGYIQDTDSTVNLPFFQGWRQVFVTYKTTTQRILFKETPKGILIDIQNAFSDKNTEEQTPSYPKSYQIKVKWPQKDLLFKVDVEEAIKSSGILFYPEHKLLKDLMQEVVIEIKFDTQTLTFIGKQQEFSLGTNDASMKNDIWGGEIPVSQTVYRDYIEMKVYCARNGKPYDGPLPLNLSSSFGVDPSGLQYGGNFNDLIDSLNKRIVNDEEFREKYPSVAFIDKEVYGGHLQEINNVANVVLSRMENYSWKSVTTKKIFKLQFLDEKGQKTQKLKANFVKGEATVKIALNEKLTNANNPRFPWIESLTLQGNISCNENTSVSFCCIFFQNEENPQQSEKHNFDWVHDVGPLLRQMALIYPSMQRIVDLYNFKGMSMGGMKRAFDIEDENNARYMPSTREMSKITHRKIRRWLYNPIFNRQAVFLPQMKKVKTMMAIQYEKLLLKSEPLPIVDFYKMKKNFINKLKGAWRVEFFTIPLYLSALFTAPNAETKHLLHTVAIDEMKHLYIVSNALNALHDEKLMGYSGAVPFYDKNSLPKYPSNPPGVFQTQDEELKKFLNYELLPCLPEQLLKFSCIELPGQTQNIHFTYLEDPQANEQNGERKKRIDYLTKTVDKINKEQQSNKNFLTIGEYYAQVMDDLWDLNDLETYLIQKGEKVQLFSGDPLKQFTYFGLENMSGIYDMRSCLNQFRLIVEEGEGANLFKLEGQMNKESHFVKFLEIYTMCNINIKTVFGESKNTQIVFEFTNADYELAPEKLAEKWSEKVVQETNEKIERQFSAQRESPGKLEDYEKKPSNPQYPSIYAPPAFTNAYEKLVEELDYLFNTDFTTFKKTHEIHCMKEEQALRQYDVFRRKRMEDSIAKMRQMTLHANKVTMPEGSGVIWVKNLGTRPSYGIGEQAKVFPPPKKE